jgi:DNA topoisomerase-1
MSSAQSLPAPRSRPRSSAARRRTLTIAKRLRAALKENAEGAPPLDPVEAARSAGLHYVSDGTPGIQRLRHGRGFRYRDPEGGAVRDAETLRRIRALAIPPAWTSVWICPSVRGHLQATGRDARGRKQYRYHPRWREVRDETKYELMTAFGETLPRVRERIALDLARSGLPREKVLATVVRLLERTLVRVGNEEYARANRSYGLTTMRDRHVEVRGARLTFRFRGKSGRQHEVELEDKRLARIVKACQDIPGQQLFQYVAEDGSPCEVTSADVNAYLREVSGQDFTAKHFRTWAGSVAAAIALRKCGPGESNEESRRNLVATIKAVAAELGNTAAVCRKCYIHPAVLESYEKGELCAALDRVARAHRKRVAGLDRDENLVLGFLRRQR